MGRMVGEPNIRYTPSNGMQVAKFSLEVGTFRWQESPEVLSVTTLIPCVIFNCPTFVASLYEGRRMLVVGSLRAKVADGVTIMNVVVDKISFLDRKKSVKATENLISPKIIGEKKWKK